MTDEQKILDKGLKIFARIIAHEMVKDGIHKSFILKNEKPKELKQCKIQR